MMHQVHLRTNWACYQLVWEKSCDVSESDFSRMLQIPNRKQNAKLEKIK